MLDRTAADYDQLKEEHDKLTETLALFRRYIFGKRRERFVDAPGQGHFFDIPEILEEPGSVVPPAEDAPQRRVDRPARRAAPVWIISLIPASSTICPRVRKTALAVVVPRH